MTSTRNESIIKKIRGLLAIANDNKSDEESQSAFLLAQKLMIKHDISSGEITERCAEQEIVKGQATAYKRLFWWERSLARIIADTRATTGCCAKTCNSRSPACWRSGCRTTMGTSRLPGSANFAAIDNRFVNQAAEFVSFELIVPIERRASANNSTGPGRRGAANACWPPVHSDTIGLRDGRVAFIRLFSSAEFLFESIDLVDDDVVLIAKFIE